MSIFLSLIILISLCSGSAFAAGEDEKSLPEENNEEWIITEMSALDEAVMKTEMLQQESRRIRLYLQIRLW